MSRATRSTSFDRRTTETQIAGRLVIDGHGKYDVRTGIRTRGRSTSQSITMTVGTV